MKKYETATITVEKLNLHDIITASFEWNPQGDGEEGNAAVYDGGGLWDDLFGG
ncbi:MAG: hypothetical protein PHT58_07815 [Eubacteriales bacterium]|nr:hypothetical protein [Eubacteriales bacterium]